MAIPSRSVSAFEAKNRLGRLLDRVEGGEELIITRHGEPVAKLVPVDKRTNNDAKNALDTFRKIRRALRNGAKISRDDIRNWKNEGRR